MSHLDEGTLHALLDGELETTEVAEIQAHLGSCSACGLRLREVEEFHGEADRLIASVELGAQPLGATPAAGQREAAPPDPIARPEAPVRREAPVRPRADAAPREPWNEPPPVLLLPDNESAADRRTRRLRRFGWAALVVGMVGAGFLGVRMRPSRPDMVPIAGRAAAESDAVVSPVEAAPRADEAVAPPESSTLALRDKAVEAKPKPAAPAPSNADSDRRQRELASTAQKAAPPAPAPAAANPSRAETDAQTIDSVAESSDNRREADFAAGGDIASVRARAAEALADLDRERRRNQAAAATAALDAERRRRGTDTPRPAAGGLRPPRRHPLPPRPRRRPSSSARRSTSGSAWTRPRGSSAVRRM